MSNGPHEFNPFAAWHVATVINACGSVTRLGGARMPPAVVDAMSKAAQVSVSIDALHAAASREIADATGAESGLVTGGAAAALTLGAAAILAGTNLGAMERLPETQDSHPSGVIANELLVARDHRSGYDHAVRAAGAKLIDVGFNEVVSGAGVRRTEAWEYASAITERTTGVLYVATPDSSPKLKELADLAHEHHLPVIVDAAGQLPPRSNLRRFIDEGADLVCFSGGKAIRGPQGTGILCGKRSLVCSATLQMLDMDDHYDLWEPPVDWIDKRSLPGMPRHGIGRAMKVSKEEIAGLLTALQLFRSGAYDVELPRMRDMLVQIADGLRHTCVTCDLQDSDCPERPSRLVISIPPAASQNASALCGMLRQPGSDGEPPIYVGHGGLDAGQLTIDPQWLPDDGPSLIVARLKQLLSAS